MTPRELQEIGREMSVARMNVPLRNRPKFDVESREFFNALGSAVRIGDDALADTLLDRWHSRVAWLTNEPRCCAAPPCLIRRPDESAIDYINRCIDAKGE